MREIRERNVSANSIKTIRDESLSFEDRMRLRLVIMLRYLYALCRLEINSEIPVPNGNQYSTILRIRTFFFFFYLIDFLQSILIENYK